MFQLIVHLKCSVGKNSRFSGERYAVAGETECPVEPKYIPEGSGFDTFGNEPIYLR
jgi:hypothetical protein